MHTLSVASSGQTDIIQGVLEVSSGVKILLVAALVFSSLGGLVVASILKKLDNIVKEYSGATANMVTALICSFLFPEKFMFTISIFIAIFLLFLGIFLYETKKAK